MDGINTGALVLCDYYQMNTNSYYASWMCWYGGGCLSAHSLDIQEPLMRNGLDWAGMFTSYFVYDYHGIKAWVEGSRSNVIMPTYGWVQHIQYLYMGAVIKSFGGI